MFIFSLSSHPRMDSGAAAHSAARSRILLGRFKALKIEETTPLDPRAVDFKYSARGIGFIRDGVLKLVSYGFI